MTTPSSTGTRADRRRAGSAQAGHRRRSGSSPLAGCKTMQRRPARHRRLGSRRLSRHPSDRDRRVDRHASTSRSASNTARLLDRRARRTSLGFAQQFDRQRQRAVIAIVAPSGSPNQVGRRRRSPSRSRMLSSPAGVSPRAIELPRLPAPAPARTVRRSASPTTAIAANTAPCGPWPDQVAKTAENRNYYDFRLRHASRTSRRWSPIRSIFSIRAA